MSKEVLSELRFDIMRAGAFPPDSVFEGLAGGQVTEGYFQDALVVGELWLVDGNDGTTGNRVFDALDVDEILLTAEPYQARPVEGDEALEDVEPAVPVAVPKKP